MLQVTGFVDSKNTSDLLGGIINMRLQLRFRPEEPVIDGLVDEISGNGLAC
jgi:hypothetical protein